MQWKEGFFITMVMPQLLPWLLIYTAQVELSSVEADSSVLD